MLISTISEHGDEVHELAISPSGKYMATADKQKCLLVWQIDFESQGISVLLVNH
jgi:WD40 repeat protein